MLNLVLALMWLAAGVGLLGMYYLTDDPRWRVTIGGGDWSLGWLALLLCVWNLVRWYAVRADRMRRQSLEELRAGRRYPARRPEPIGEPDPAFNFSDDPPPPPPPVRHPGDAPPPS
jgi:hypothetical protein